MGSCPTHFLKPQVEYRQASKSYILQVTSQRVVLAIIFLLLRNSLLDASSLSIKATAAVANTNGYTHSMYTACKIQLAGPAEWWTLHRW